jgi:uncharacterized protein YndB with AHSA1/START domain/catechol 2,3-dioxygenase-like lactoylglutathione lyase family enzyme
VAAPAERVFAAFTEADQLARWWGPRGFSIPSLEFQPHAGARYRIEMQPPEGDAFYLTGEFGEVDPPARLAFTFAWEDPDPDDVENLSSRSGSWMVRPRSPWSKGRSGPRPGASFIARAGRTASTSSRSCSTRDPDRPRRCEDAGRQPTRRCQMADLPAPEEGIALTHFIVSDDVERSRRFYTEVLGGETVREGEPSFVALANSWIIINVGGGPTDDKPTVTLETPPDPDRISSFLNIRVADIEALYSDWRARGAEFLTPPKRHEHEIRCYIRDPDGHLIEVGQAI